ncbi:MAG: diaminopropionate ammonia-lyase [Rhodospirillaceae bacterium]|nr:diaminopropionate ammonia-lyase [Rhodospirillaceae bacterium]|tara:strand:- start:6575 stop:7780 length:1206 start_codon:yes stop_codon:yes gene_type:complete
MTHQSISADLRLHLNWRCDRNAPYGDQQKAVIDTESRQMARRTIAAWPGYAPTPLVDLPGLAKELGVARIRIKHEAKRFTLKSFKALGGAYGVMRILQRETGASIDDIMAGKVKDKVAGVTVCCATDGNHGRAVAWGAQLAGARCVIYLHSHVSEGREAAIAAYGAEIARIDGNYDDSVRQAAEDAKANGWIVVSDTSWPGYEEIPAWVKQGYTVIMGEAMEQLGDDRPSHLFVQAGVGGLACAAIGPLWEDWGADRPFCTVVEPHEADCIYQSAVQGQMANGLGSLDTVMACLSAGEASPLAWAILQTGADAFITIDDHFSPGAMRRFAYGGEDGPMVVGESGCAGLAGLMAMAADPLAREAVGLGPDADVLLIASEGATDPSIYEEIIGKPADAVGETI